MSSKREVVYEYFKCEECNKDIDISFFIQDNITFIQCFECRNRKYDHCICGKRAVFNIDNKKEGIRCAEHKESDMVNVKSKTCIHDGCRKQPIFNKLGETKAIYCVEHKDPDMANVKSKTCIHDGCRKQPNFNKLGETKAIYCAEHKESDMVNVKSKTCIHDGCRKQPIFNKLGEKKAIYCADHKDPDMVDVKHKTCIYDGCRKIPTFNKLGETNGIYCAEHKDPDMVDVKNKTCIYDGCRKRPTFNKLGETNGIYCTEHKDPDMVNVKNKTCIYDGCRKIPTFNKLGETNGIYCAEHKESDMVDVKHKICIYNGCRKIPTFNKLGEKNGIYCAEHKESDMVDVKNKTCIYDGCNTRAYYGIPGQLPTYCTRHGKKITGLIQNPSTQCIEGMCKEKAIFGIKKPLHCETHKEKEDENLCLQPCKMCKNIEICNKDGVCFEYCINNELFQRGKHLKELRILKLLEEKIKQGIFSYDKIIDSSCNKYRPDIVYETPTHFVVVEIDESQHSNYEKGCDISRMKAITFSLGMPVFFIRYNPDEYKDSSGKKSKILKGKREDILLQWVRHAIDLSPENDEDYLRVMYLFYDGFSESDRNIKIMDIYEINIYL